MTAKMRPSLCPCMSLEVGVIVVAVLDAVFYCHTSFFISSQMFAFPVYSYNPKSHRIIEFANFLLHSSALLMAIGLFIGSQKKNTALCWAWIVHTAVFTVVVVSFLLVIDGKCCGFELHRYYYSNLYVNLGIFLWISVELYFACVVYAFIKQLRQVDPHQANVELRGLTPTVTQLQPKALAIVQPAELAQVSTISGDVSQLKMGFNN